MYHELINVLCSNAVRFPDMETQDAVKLLYQNTFGGGHLITDRAATLVRLQTEYAATPHIADMPLFEDIGFGFVRVNLAALDTNVYRLSQLNDDFVESACQVKSDLDEFKSRLRFLYDNYSQFGFGFSKDDLAEYLEKYAAEGYPMVSHSERYRTAYHPAYRVLLRSCIKMNI